MTTLDQGTNRVKTSWNYADVIALITANLEGERFNGDRGVWLRGISELADRYPTFFRRVHFVHRDPLPPYSREVDEVLKMLGKWEYQGSFNPRFRVIEVSEDAKSELKSQLAQKFESGDLATIQAMSRSFAKHVKLEQGETANVRDPRPTPGRD